MSSCSTCSSTRAAASTCCARCSASSPASRFTCCPTSRPSLTAATPSGWARAASSTRALISSAYASWSSSAPQAKGRLHMQAAAVIALQQLEKRMPAPRKHAASCSTCNLRELCLPGALDAQDLARVDNLVYARRRVKRGDALYQAGAEFSAIYAIRSGSFKASLLDGEGRE